MPMILMNDLACSDKTATSFGFPIDILLACVPQLNMYYVRCLQLFTEGATINSSYTRLGLEIPRTVQSTRYKTTFCNVQISVWFSTIVGC